MRDGATLHIRWPAERFLWAIVDAPGTVRDGLLPVGLRGLVEDEIPGGAEDLHAVCAAGADGRVVMCAASMSDLAALPVEALSLTPERLPGFAATLDPKRLNLLVGASEPRPLRDARARRRSLALATTAACAALATFGLSARARFWEHEATGATSASGAVLASAGGAESRDAMSLELVRLRSVAQAAPKEAVPADAALAAAGLLAAWPNQVSCQVQSISVSGAGIAIGLLVDGDAAPFLAAFKPPSGWSLEEPRITSVGKQTRVNLQLRPAAGARP